MTVWHVTGFDVSDTNGVSDTSVWSTNPASRVGYSPAPSSHLRLIHHACSDRHLSTQARWWVWAPCQDVGHRVMPRGFRHQRTHPYITTASDGSAVRRRASWRHGHLSLISRTLSRTPAVYLGQIASCHAYRGVVWRQGDEPERALYAADQVRSGTRSHDSESCRGTHTSDEDIWGRETHSNL